MEISPYFAGACAVGAISNLGIHKHAVDAMKAFCRQQLGIIDGSFVRAYSTLISYYIFVAGPEVAAGLPGSSHHSKAWVKYGTEFAQFILDNGLGEIATLPARLNLKHHPSTTAQVWLWAPNQKALEAWWEQNK